MHEESFLRHAMITACRISRPFRCPALCMGWAICTRSIGRRRCCSRGRWRAGDRRSSLPTSPNCRRPIASSAASGCIATGARSPPTRRCTFGRHHGLLRRGQRRPARTRAARCRCGPRASRFAVEPAIGAADRQSAQLWRATVGQQQNERLLLELIQAGVRPRMR